MLCVLHTLLLSNHRSCTFILSVRLFFRKFWSNNTDRKLITNYEYLLVQHKSNRSWLHKTAGQDVKNLDLAPNKEAFMIMWKIIKCVWTKEGEKKLADHVAKQYTESKNWMNLFANCYGIEQYRPNQQSIERHFLVIKGSASVVSCRIVSCRIVSYRIVSYRIVSYFMGSRVALNAGCQIF